MKFVIDAQLPKKMAEWLRSAGCDAMHTLDLPNGNRTTDKQLVAFADSEGRVVVTKDDDFVDSHLLHGQPAKLLLVSTGNIRNRDLEALTVPLIPNLLSEFNTHSFLELSSAGLTIRG
jgi:predicted nuclease of predicted toxin-antitoxin system